MAIVRIAGVNIPTDKNAEIALTRVFGIGRPTALVICKKLGIDPLSKIKSLTETELEAIRTEIGNYTIEGDLRREISLNIKRLTDLGCYRGVRHRRGLPLRGQRTRTNARTRKGKAKPVRK